MAGRQLTCARFAGVLAALLYGCVMQAAEVSFDSGFVKFDDAPLEEPLAFPDWFKLSFLDLREDIEEVKGGRQAAG